ncbi:MAG: glycosyltransferase family 4 protein, partial [Acidobacteriota bacterium]|nr:glycosyltransferase family 4 protein [Acidobacteriota bacterium]
MKVLESELNHKKVKIAILIETWKGAYGTGIKKYVMNINEGLKKREDFEVNVVYLKGDDPENYKISGHRFLFPIKAFFVPGKIKPQIIYSQSSWYFPFTGYLYKKFYGAKLITTVHSYPDKKLSILGKSLMDFLWNRCDCVTFVSKGVERKTEEFWGINFKVRKEITYAGVRAKEISEKDINEFRKKFAITEKHTVLLAQSFPIAKVKADGAKLLMKAVKELRNRYPNIILVLTGEGPYKNELKQFAKSEGICDNTIFTGWVDNPFIPLAICDVYTHITLGEGGVSLALLEAMSIGKPIIATSVGGIPEAIEDGGNGILIEPDVDAIIDKIEC